MADDPSLVRERFAGRTLLHEASAQGNLAMVEVLLRLGADVNAKDGGGIIRCIVWRMSTGDRGAERWFARLLAGVPTLTPANGVKRCTALHMAARRGSAEIAEALLDCGAGIEAGDSLGDTPLRRSVNCDTGAAGPPRRMKMSRRRE